MDFETEAIVLKRFDFSESSQIGHLLTRSHGRLGALAKGIKKPNAALKGPMDLFQRARVRLTRRAGSDLFLVARFEPLTAHPLMRDDVDRMYAGFYLTELFHAGTREMDADPALFDLLAVALLTIEDAAPQALPALVAATELKYLAVTGLRPAVEGCARCGAVVRDRPLRFFPLDGGLVCQACRGSGMAGMTIEPGILAFLAKLSADRLIECRRLKLAARQAQVLRGLMNALIDGALERPLESRRFVGRTDHDHRPTVGAGAAYGRR